MVYNPVIQIELRINYMRLVVFIALTVLSFGALAFCIFC